MNMEPGKQPIEFYNEQLAAHQTELKALQKKKSVFGFLRLGAVLTIILVFYLLFQLGWMYYTPITIVLAIIFVRLIHIDLDNRDKIVFTKRLIAIQEAELKCLDFNYKHNYDGVNEQPVSHYYADDMDVVGKASIFQYLNRTGSEQGEKKLANWLLYPSSLKEIKERQIAIEEEDKKIDWIQDWIAMGQQERIEMTMQKNLEAWIAQPYSFKNFRHWKWLRFLLPAIILIISVLTMYDHVSMSFFYLSLFVFAVIAYQINKVVAPIHNQLNNMAAPIAVLAVQINHFEKTNFNSPLWEDLKTQLKNKTDITASASIKKLGKILGRLDLRYNMVLSFPLNIFLLWSLQQALDLEKWKEENKEQIKNWFNVLAEIEALNSLSVLSFNHPQWTQPVFEKEYFSFEATELGHPLIPTEKRVNNNVSVENRSSIHLVTGSNMGGKSTFLRSIGVNIILAMAGAKVCATSFKMSPAQLMSSMRIADNLEESTSTFYAELKKLKTIIEQVNAGEEVFILLDEILRGTNSFDRHAGSAALIKQLIAKSTPAILATHDVELAAMQKDFPKQIVNSHFDVQVSGEELYFDYKLKPGICTSMNATILMKKIGLDVEV